MKNILNTIKDYAPAVIALAIILGSSWWVINHTAKYKAEYASQHDCIWDSNDMCYTIDERPWLFK